MELDTIKYCLSRETLCEKCRVSQRTYVAAQRFTQLRKKVMRLYTEVAQLRKKKRSSAATQSSFLNQPEDKWDWNGGYERRAGRSKGGRRTL